MTDLACVTFSVPLPAADAVGDLLAEEGRGVEVRDQESTPPAKDGTIEYRVWLPREEVDRRVEQITSLLSSLETMGITTQPWEWHSEDVREEDWQETYKQYFTLSRVGHRFMIKPSWIDYTPEPDDLMIELDPGMAFGTGLHPSTRLVLRALERVARSGPPPQQVVDLGCGSGILSIAAARLWPGAQVLAIDVDPSAVSICLANVQQNGLADRIRVEARSASEMSGTFGLVLANLNVDALTSLKHVMPLLVDDFGHIVLSGLLADQAKAISRLYSEDVVLEPEYTEEEDGWRSILMRLRD